MGVYTPLEEPRSPAQMASLTNDDAMRLIAQRTEKAARADLVHSLAIMGRFEEALEIETDDEKKAWLKAMIAAEEAPDEERCKCRHFIDVADYARNPNAEPVPKAAPNYLPQFRHWSEKYGAMVWFRVCHMCGHPQTIDGEMDEVHSFHVQEQANALDTLLNQLGKPAGKKQI